MKARVLPLPVGAMLKRSTSRMGSCCWLDCSCASRCARPLSLMFRRRAFEIRRCLVMVGKQRNLDLVASKLDCSSEASCSRRALKFWRRRQPSFVILDDLVTLLMTNIGTSVACPTIVLSAGPHPSSLSDTVQLSRVSSSAPRPPFTSVS
ncbi:hypothetical protein KCU61_g434, partial [Aureobasidium melanogenum]